ncbi:7-deoxyloganetin glucosyltransferase-like [Quercus suber]|uniref:7-deoxyloganetin glucosyltransferase-like n=1 Tax=Quercus suber TaxID=58331 RepID=UPI0032DF1068
MLKLAKLLHHKGFHVTFVNTEYIHKRLLRSRGPNSLDGLPDFHFETITDGLPPVDADVSQDIIALAESTTKACLLPLCNLISKLNDTSSSNVPPVTCIVADGCMSFTLDAAESSIWVTGGTFEDEVSLSLEMRLQSGSKQAFVVDSARAMMSWLTSASTGGSPSVMVSK